MSQEDFTRRFDNSLRKRTKRRGLLRNVAVALRRLEVTAVTTLAVALHGEEPLVRGYAA